MRSPDPEPWRADAAAAGPDIDAALVLARRVGRDFTELSARRGLEILAAVAAGDLTVARVVEPHVDALTILAEAGLDAQALPDATWGVFAAEAPGVELRAVPTDDGWRLTGTKPWCSLAGVLDRALVTATTPTGRRLFAVGLREPGVRVADAGWVARGLSAVTSGPVDFTAVSAEPVGADGWYLTRPGFASGAVRVAACWFGGLEAVSRHLSAELSRRPELDPIRAYNLGRAEVARWSAELALRYAGEQLDGGPTDAAAAVRLALRTRAVVAGAVETVLAQSGHALGPAPLAFDEIHARRAADLTLYVRQHHAERDLAELGRRLVSA